MSTASHQYQFQLLLREHHVLMRSYARTQTKCSAILRQQALEIERMGAEAMQMRAALIIHESMLQWEREDRAELEKAIPGLPARLALKRQVEELVLRVQNLMRGEFSGGQLSASPSPELSVDAVALEASLKTADLVICQTGCLSHGSYWRVQDHCKRTGKACVLVEQPDALRIVRINKGADGEGASITSLMQEA